MGGDALVALISAVAALVLAARRLQGQGVGLKSAAQMALIWTILITALYLLVRHLGA